jgi:hypothetical protein
MSHVTCACACVHVHVHAQYIDKGRTSVSNENKFRSERREVGEKVGLDRQARAPRTEES